MVTDNGRTPNGRLIDCWAASLGDRSQKQSREHIVSEGLWNQVVEVQGLHWCKDSPKRIGISSLTEKTLCDEHNRGLSPADLEGKRLFEALGTAADLAYSAKQAGSPPTLEIGAFRHRWSAN